jgi:anti-sigma regulatory factor (Ser/Thr protein kinase)
MVTRMANSFENPDFSSGDIELRLEGDDICIYATDAGLDRIVALCKSLREGKSNEHLHLEDHFILTEKSLKGVIAKLEKSG